MILKEEGPETMLNLFDGESDTPELIWDASMRGELRKVAGLELDSCMQLRRETGRGNDNFCLRESVMVKFAKLEDELLVGGVYVARFLKEPTFNLRDPTSFLEALLLRWTHELQICTENESSGEEKFSTDIILGGKDNLQPVTDAIVYLCKVRTNLCDKLAQWGYMSRCLAFLENTLARDLLGSPLLSIMRILHVAANRRVNVESIIASGTNDSVHGIIAFTMRAVGDSRLHPDAGFMLEMLKKIFVDALGDVEKAAELQKSVGMNRTTFIPGNHSYAMAPSPAPGEDPVSRNRVRVNMGDDPLGLGAETAPLPVQTTSQPNTAYTNTSQTYGRSQTGISSVSGQQWNQMAYSQPGNLQSYGGGYQQQQQANYGQTMYGNSFNTPGMQQQSYSAQTQQSVQAQNSYHQNLGQSTQRQQQQPSNSYYSNVNQNAYSYGGATQFAHAQQQNKPIQSNTMPSGQANRFGVNSRQTSNMAYQSNNTSNQMPMNQSVPVSQKFQTPQYQSTTSNQTFVEANQVKPPQNSVPTGNMINQMPASTSQPQNVPYQAPQTSVPNQHQQTRTSFANTNTAPQHYNNNSQSTNSNLSTANQQYQQAPVTNLDSNIPSYQQPHQPAMHQSSVPTVETVAEDDRPGMSTSTFTATNSPPPHFQQGQPMGQPTMPSNEGLGIDARSQPEPPSVQAAKAVETIQGAPNSADGRKVLLESALRCDLAKYLIESVLENPALPKVKDAASVKVHAVELLKLLTKDPGYGLKFKLLLEAIPAWKKYASQDHSLFITGVEQKADYFLTDGSSSLEAKKLLTNK